MRFDNGMLGLCISVLAIIGMVMSGFFLSVQESERVVTGYDYITDVSGLFEYSQDPQYVPYNPSENWSGFYTSDPGITAGISYTAQQVANSYPIGQESSVIASDTVDLEALNLEQLSPPVVHESPQLTRWGVVFDREAPTEGTPVYDTPYPGVATLQTLIGSMDLPAGTDTVTITLGDSRESPVIIPVSSWAYRVWAPPLSSQVEAYTATVYRADAAASVTIDLESGVAIGYSSSGAKIWNGSASGMCIVYGGEAVESSPTQWNLDTSVSYSAYETPAPIYIDTNAGLSLSESPVSWNNGYHVGSIEILFRVPDTGRAYVNTLSIPLADGPDGAAIGTLEAYISVTTGGRVQVSLDDGVQQTIDIGQWRNFILSMDFIDGSYAIIPVIDFVTFNDYTEMDEARQFDRITMRGTAETITWGYTGNSLALGVVNTSVFMNTYGVVMTDPSLAISEYFPDLADIRLNFYSFALYGDSITVNGQIFEVNESAMINIPYEDDGEMLDSWHTLTNIYVTFEDHTYITFVNDGYTADLGPTTTDRISFSGHWYFTTGLYEGYETTETYYEWTVDRFIFESDGAIMVFLGLLVLGTAIGARIVGIHTLDIVVIVCAGLFAIVMLGVF